MFVYTPLSVYLAIKIYDKIKQLNEDKSKR